MLLLTCVGIINGIAITRYGSRTVCIAGSVIGTIGFALGSRATSIVHLYLTLGILAGLFCVQFSSIFFTEVGHGVGSDCSISVDCSSTCKCICVMLVFSQPSDLSLAGTSKIACDAIWSPYKMQDIKTTEKAQKRARKQVKGLHSLSYKNRLRQLDIPSLRF